VGAVSFTTKNKGKVTMEYFTDAYKRYADFTGRATRTQYWMFILIFMIIYIILAAIDSFLIGTIALSAIFNLVSLIPSLAIAARRLHDTGRSGWWQLIILLPLIGIIVLLVFLVMDSEGDNRFGANLKAA
jgi:uncharacterized membrane protein YhaH (DUF805 family)